LFDFIYAHCPKARDFFFRAPEKDLRWRKDFLGRGVITERFGQFRLRNRSAAEFITTRSANSTTAAYLFCLFDFVYAYCSKARDFFFRAPEKDLRWRKDFLGRGVITERFGQFRQRNRSAAEFITTRSANSTTAACVFVKFSVFRPGIGESFSVDKCCQ